MKKQNLEKVWPVMIQQDGGNFEDSRFNVVLTGEFMKSLKVLMSYVDLSRCTIEQKVVWGFIYTKLDDIINDSMTMLADEREEMNKK